MLSASKISSTTDALSELERLRSDFGPTKERKRAEMTELMGKARGLEARLQRERDEATLELSEWKALGKDPVPGTPAADLVLLPGPMRGVEAEMQAAWAQLEHAQDGTQAKLDGVLARLYTCQRIGRVSAKLSDWLSSARSTLATIASPTTEAEALVAIREAERVAAEARVMGGVMAEARQLEELITNDSELGERAHAMMVPLAEIDAVEEGLAAKAEAMRVTAESEHARLAARAAEERTLALQLFELSVSLQTADELIENPMPTIDTTAVSRRHASMTHKLRTRPPGPADPSLSTHPSRTTC